MILITTRTYGNTSGWFAETFPGDIPELYLEDDEFPTERALTIPWFSESHDPHEWALYENMILDQQEDSQENPTISNAPLTQSQDLSHEYQPVSMVDLNDLYTNEDERHHQVPAPTAQLGFIQSNPGILVPHRRGRNHNNQRGTITIESFTRNARNALEEARQLLRQQHERVNGLEAEARIILNEHPLSEAENEVLMIVQERARQARADLAEAEDNERRRSTELATQQLQYYVPTAVVLPGWNRFFDDDNGALPGSAVNSRTPESRRRGILWPAAQVLDDLEERPFESLNDSPVDSVLPDWNVSRHEPAPATDRQTGRDDRTVLLDLPKCPSLGPVFADPISPVVYKGDDALNESLLLPTWGLNEPDETYSWREFAEDSSTAEDGLPWSPISASALAVMTLGLASYGVGPEGDQNLPNSNNDEPRNSSEEQELGDDIPEVKTNGTGHTSSLPSLPQTQNPQGLVGGDSGLLWSSVPEARRELQEKREKIKELQETKRELGWKLDREPLTEMPIGEDFYLELEIEYAEMTSSLILLKYECHAIENFLDHDQEKPRQSENDSNGISGIIPGVSSIVGSAQSNEGVDMSERNGIYVEKPCFSLSAKKRKPRSLSRVLGQFADPEDEDTPQSSESTTAMEPKGMLRNSYPTNLKPFCGNQDSSSGIPVVDASFQSLVDDQRAPTCLKCGKKFGRPCDLRQVFSSMQDLKPSR